ncbi:MAG TPA: hypothetical protein VNI79_00865 [Sphingomicrobium sp.]|nr:hypothetical protein [Sphingomicrobium sp.]
MNATNSRPASSWAARIAWGLLLLFAGAGLAAWGLTKWDAGARFLGIAPAPRTDFRAQLATPAPIVVASPADTQRVAALEERLALLERQTQSARGSAGRADALVVAFAARRSLERGVALGYLEPLLVERFGATHQRAVATVVTASRVPVIQNDLVAEFERIGPVLRGKSSDESWLDGVRREMGALISIRRNDTPNPRPAARFDRAMARLEAGEIDAALAEAMRLPGASRPEARGWVVRARRLIATKRALDEIESAALIAPPPPAIGA